VWRFRREGCVSDVRMYTMCGLGWACCRPVYAWAVPAHRASLIGMNGRVCACMGRAVYMSGSAGRCVGRVSVWTECMGRAGESPDLGVRAAREDVWAVCMCVYRVCIRVTVLVHGPCRVCVWPSWTRGSGMCVWPCAWGPCAWGPCACGPEGVCTVCLCVFVRLCVCVCVGGWVGG